MSAGLESEIRRFVSQVLGCGCPDEVLALIEVDGEPPGFAGLPVDYRIVVGKRLMILICESRPWQEVAKALGPLVRAGRRARDEDALNRLRLVVATEDQRRAERSLRPALGLLADADDRVHLHLVPPKEVARLGLG